MYQLDQNSTPLFSALQQYQADKVVSFHVPGHKQGVGCPELTEYLGPNLLAIDVTVHEQVDCLANPRGVIKQAEALAADLYGVQAVNFLVNGTSSGIQAMIMSVCQPGDKIILPRNAHKSVNGALALSGAIPVYIQPEVSDRLGFAMGVTPATVEAALQEHPDAKAVFIINSTYYGMASDLATIVDLAHRRGVVVLVDEAHGAHFHFHSSLPLSGAAAGADMCAASTHKLLGSLTQSSMLLVNSPQVAPHRVKQVLNLMSTTSPSYVLLASLDVARRRMALHGHQLWQRTIDLCNAARQQLNQIPGVYVPGNELDRSAGCWQYDPTKLVINLRQVGISGFEAERLLREQFGIQVELSDLYNVLAVGAVGDTEQSMQRLVTAVRELVQSHRGAAPLTELPFLPARLPEVVVPPREAFYLDSYAVPLEQSRGLVAAENVMAYPPGIPLICTGERVTDEVIECIQVLKAKRSHLQGTEDPELNYLRVLSYAVEHPVRVAN
ncbi:MAG: aminotransferase class I/II-fold pyridoxal phosphate-dependent enzyme [Bacillota bacterium]|jgi:arginine decarboxylase